MIMDNKRYDTPTSLKGRDHLQKQRVRGQIRLPGEGLQDEYTKPNAKKHRKNVGGTVNIMAGISGDRVVLWEEVGSRWCGQRAAEMYSGPVIKCLRKLYGNKRKFLIAEDNDPTGYKSSKGKAAKKELGIQTVDWPPYSPDLMPLDFSLWENIRVRMEKTDPAGNESALAFKKRLRLTALRTPKAVVRKMTDAMLTRAQAIYDADGGHIDCD